MRIVTAQDIEQKELCEEKISVMSGAFDSLMGGIPLGQLTEICGQAGVGKTQV